MDRRVVVTGMGAVTPLGCTVDTFWEGLKNGKCGIDLIQKFDTTDFKVKVGAEVKDFDPELYMSKKDVKRNDPYAVYALAAAVQAFDDSGLDMEKEDAAKVGVIVGSGIGRSDDNAEAGGFVCTGKRTFSCVSFVYSDDDQ